MHECHKVPMRAVSKGEYVKRKADAKTVYIRGDYDRATTKMNTQYKFFFNAAMMQEAAGNREQAEKFFAMAMLYAKS